MGNTRSGASERKPPVADKKEGGVATTLQPEGTVLKTDLSSKVDVYVRLESLTHLNPTLVVVYSKWVSENVWTEVGMTETSDGANPGYLFKNKFQVLFRVERMRMLRFEAYLVKDRARKTDLAAQRYLGCIECSLVDAMMARRAGSGWLTLPMQHPKWDVPSYGKICAFVEEDTSSKQLVSFELFGKDLRSTDVWKRKTDAYFVMHRTVAVGEELELKCTPIYKSEVQRKTCAPAWKRCELSMAQISGNDLRQDLVIEVFDWFRVQPDRYLGECRIRAEALPKAASSSSPIVLPIRQQIGQRFSIPASAGRKATSKSSKLSSSGLGSSRTGTKLSRQSEESRRSDGSKSRASSGSATSGQIPEEDPSLGKILGYLTFDKVGGRRRYTFMDFLRSGLDFRLIVAIDLTRSNAPSSGDGSLHVVNPDVPNAYISAIRAIGQVMSSYDTDDSYPVYGIGAKVPPTHTVSSNCFALNGDFLDPEVSGIEGIVKAYLRALNVVRLHGPTRYRDVIKLVCDISEEFKGVSSTEGETDEKDAGENKESKEQQSQQLKYYVLLVLTDGESQDEEDTIEELVRASDLPVSVLFIGVGDGDFRFLRSLAGEVRNVQRAEAEEDDDEEREVVHFIRYNDFRGRPNELASAALASIPGDAVTYFDQFNIKPPGLDKFEDAGGAPQAVEIPPEAMKEMTSGAEKRKSRSHGRHDQLLLTQSNMQSRRSTKTGSVFSADGRLDESVSSGTKSVTGTKSVLGTKSLPGTKSHAGTKSVPGTKSRTSGTKELASGTQDLEAEMIKARRDMARAAQEKLEQMPRFLREERARLIEEAVELGYDEGLVDRSIKDGLPEPTIEMLVDTIMNAGYGGIPTMKDSLAEILPDLDDEDTDEEPALQEGPRLASRLRSIGVRNELLRKITRERTRTWSKPCLGDERDTTQELMAYVAAALSRQGYPIDAQDSNSSNRSSPRSRARTRSNGLARGRSPNSSTSRGPTHSPSRSKEPARKSTYSPTQSKDVTRSESTMGRASPIRSGLRNSKDVIGTGSITQGGLRRLSKASRGPTKSKELSFMLEGSEPHSRTITSPAKTKSKEAVGHLEESGTPVHGRRMARTKSSVLSFDLPEDQLLPGEVPEPMNSKSQSLRVAGQASPGDRANVQTAVTSGIDQSKEMCGFCKQRPVETRFLPCGHQLYCEGCAPNVGIACPLCQQQIRSVCTVGAI